MLLVFYKVKCFNINDTNDSSILQTDSGNIYIKYKDFIEKYPIKQKKLIIKHHGIFDPSLFKEMFQDESENGINNAIKHLKTIGCDSYSIVTDKYKILYINSNLTPFIRREKTTEDPLGLGSEMAKKLQGSSFYRLVAGGLYGNTNIDNLDQLSFSYFMSSGRKLHYIIYGLNYKKDIQIGDARVPILKIYIQNKNHDLPDEVINYLKKENPYLKEQSIFLKIVNLFMETPSFLSNVGRMDIDNLEKSMQDLGYLDGTIINKNILYSNNGAAIVYSIRAGKKYSLDQIIVKSKYLSKEEINNITNQLNFVFKDNKLSICSKKQVENVVASMGYKAVEVHKVSRFKGKFDLHVLCELDSNLDSIENIFFRTIRISPKYLYSMAGNCGMFIGGQFTEKAVNKMKGYLDKFTGNNINFNQQNENGRILIFDGDKEPDRIQFLQNLLRMKLGSEIEISPWKWRWFAIKKRPCFFFISPGLSFDWSSPLVSAKIGCGLNFEYLTLNDCLFSFEVNLPFNISRSYGTLKEYLKEWISKEKSINDLKSEIFTPFLQFGIKKKFNKNEFDLGFKFCIVSEKKNMVNLMEKLGDNIDEIITKLQPQDLINNLLDNSFYGKNLEDILEKLKKKLSDDQIVDLNNKIKEKYNNSLNKNITFNLSNNFKREIFNKYNKTLNLNINNQPYGFFGDKLEFGGNKLTTVLYYTSKMFDYSLVSALIFGTSICPKITSSLLDINDFRIVCVDKIHALKTGIMFRLFLLKEIIDSSFIMGARLAVLSYGIFINGGYVNRIIACKDFNFNNIKWEFTNLFSAGCMMTLDIFGVLCFFIAIGVDLNGKPIIDIGLISNFNSQSLGLPNMGA